MFSNDIGITIIVTTLLILLLVAVVVITIFVSNRRHVQQEVKMAQMLLDYEKDIRLVQEQVMTAVARELHDNIGQRLTFMNMQLEQQKQVNPVIASPLQPINDMMVQTIDEVRMLGRSLNSDLIEKNGLVYTVGKEVERLQQLNKYEVHWDNDEQEPQLNKDQKVMVFRVFQEILNNLLKHAAAKNIYISLYGKSNFKMIVKDDGKGFEFDEIMSTAKGAGLKNILKRADLAKLACHIETATGKGTTFTFEQII